MTIKLIIESRQLLTELKWNEVIKRFKSKKFVRLAKKLSLAGVEGGEAYWEKHYSRQPGQSAFDRYLEHLEELLVGTEEYHTDFIPEDISEKEKAEALNWLISACINTQSFPLLEDEVHSSLETFYQIKNLAPDLLGKNSLMAISTWRELEAIIIDARPGYLAHVAAKEEEGLARKGGEGANLIKKDHPVWDVFIPETQMAARFLGRGTTWCTATNPKTSHNYYSTYHTEKNPLYIFIKRTEPSEKYQFSYWRNDFANKVNQQVGKRTKLFHELNNIIKELGAPIITESNLEFANRYAMDSLDESLQRLQSLAGLNPFDN